MDTNTKGVNKIVETDKRGLRKRGLGKGLSALMASTTGLSSDLSHTELDSRDAQRAEYFKSNVANRSNRAESEVEAPDSGLVYLPLERITPNRNQPRQHFDQGEIRSLADSLIQTGGLLQPILVRRRQGEIATLASYEIIAGERRFLAARQAGLHQIPAIVKDLSDKDAFQLAIIENIQRANLNPIEEAQAYQRLIDEFGDTQEAVAKLVGKDRVSVANTLRLLKLAPKVREMIIERKISAGHGRALLIVHDLDAQVLLADRIVAEALSVRAVERLAALSATKEPGELASRSTDSLRSDHHLQSLAVLELENRIRQSLGTKVKLFMTSQGKGEVRISFYSRDELESLLEKFGA